MQAQKSSGPTQFFVEAVMEHVVMKLRGVICTLEQPPVAHPFLREPVCLVCVHAVLGIVPARRVRWGQLIEDLRQQSVSSSGTTYV